MISVMLVDDHEVVREGLCGLIEGQPDMKVVGQAATGLEALKMARKLGPDVVLMDISMPDINGIEATRLILEAHPGSNVLCLSMHDDKRFLTEALRAGASGYLLKDCDIKELLTAVRAVSRGQRYVSPLLAGQVLQNLEELRGDRGGAFTLLTPREREVLQLIAEGLSTKEIADRLCLSDKTIATHRQHIMEKLEITSVAGLVKYAIREGIAQL